MDRKKMDEPGTDEWFVNKLATELSKVRSVVRNLEKWMDGEPDIPNPDNDRPHWEKLQRIARVNVAELIVEARLHRMKLLGASTKLDNSPNGDDVVAQLFNELDLVRKFQEAFRYALAQRRGYIIVSGDSVRVSGPGETIVKKDGDGNTIAALYMYRDEMNDRDVMILARPGYTRHMYKTGLSQLPGHGKVWMLVPDAWELQPPVPSGVEGVPVFEFSTVDGKSLLEKHLPTMERINHGVLQRLILIAMQAFRQRALKGLPLKDKEGNDIDYTGAFESAPDSVWALPPNVDIWESGQADLSSVLNAVKDDLRYLAVESKTPLYMISPDDANGSAEGASTQRETLVFDVEALIGVVEAPVKAVLGAVLRQRGEAERADPAAFKLIWSAPRRSSLTERAQAALTAKNAGIPFRLVMEKFAELAPDEVADALQQRNDDMFLNAVAGIGGKPAQGGVTDGSRNAGETDRSTGASDSGTERDAR